MFSGLLHHQQCPDTNWTDVSCPLGHAVVPVSMFVGTTTAPSCDSSTYDNMDCVYKPRLYPASTPYYDMMIGCNGTNSCGHISTPYSSGARCARINQQVYIMTYQCVAVGMYTTYHVIYHVYVYTVTLVISV